MKKEKKTLREIFDLYIEARTAEGKVITKASFQPVKSIIYFIENKKGTPYLTQSLFKEWREDRNRPYGAMCVVRNFLYYAKIRGYLNIRCPKPVYVGHPKARVLDQPLKESVISDMLTDFIKWRKKSIPLNNNYHYILIRFNNYCREIWTKATELTNEMIEDWCKQNDHESMETRNCRIAPITLFVNYAIAHGWKNISAPKAIPCVIKRSQNGHIFSKVELKKLFEQCDSLTRHPTESMNEFHRRSMVLSVIYRFMYSTGMKVIDVVSLNVKDVDLENGIISFTTYNGRGHCRIALCDSTLVMVKNFAESISKVIPERVSFFPNKNGLHLSTSCLQVEFKKLWAQISDSKVKLSDLRTTYAVENINSWDDKSMDWTIQLLHLSKAMGHSSMKNTEEYLTLVPRFQDILNSNTAENLRNIASTFNNRSSYEEKD